MGFLRKKKAPKGSDPPPAEDVAAASGSTEPVSSTFKKRPDVVDSAPKAGKDTKLKWRAVWDRRYEARMKEESKWIFDPAVKQLILDQEAAGVIMAPSYDAIEFFFEFLDMTNARYFTFTPDDWAELDTDVQCCFDQENESFHGPHSEAVDVGMEWLVFECIKKITASDGIALLDLFKGLKKTSIAHPYGVSVVGPATDFHSYTWQESVCSTYQALTQHLDLLCQCKDTRYFWWDCFCQNQWNMGDVGHTFTTTIKQITNLCFSSPDFLSPKAMTRVWCQYELATAVINGKRIFILPGSYGDAESWGTSSIDPLDQWVPVEDSTAKYMADKDMLLNKIDTEIEGGQEHLNNVVREAFVGKALGYRLWYMCQWERNYDGFKDRIKGFLDQGADPNFSNGYNTALDSLGDWSDDVESSSGQVWKMLRDAGGKRNDELIAALDEADVLRLGEPGSAADSSDVEESDGPSKAPAVGKDGGIEVAYDGSKVHVSYSVEGARSSSDYVAVYQVGASDSDYIAYAYASGDSAGKCSIDHSATPGVQYDVRYIDVGGSAVATSKPFKEEMAMPAGMPQAGGVVAHLKGNTVKCTWSLSNPGLSNYDYVGVYEIGEDDGTYMTYEYTSGGSDGSKDIDVDGYLTKGKQYNVRYIFGSTYKSLATSAPFTA